WPSTAIVMFGGARRRRCGIPRLRSDRRNRRRVDACGRTAQNTSARRSRARNVDGSAPSRGVSREQNGGLAAGRRCLDSKTDGRDALMYDVTLFGRLEVRVNGQQLKLTETRHQDQLLAVLALIACLPARMLPASWALDYKSLAMLVDVQVNPLHQL